MSVSKTLDLTHKALQDLALAGACIVCAAFVLPRMNAFEWLSTELRRGERLQLDDLLLTCGIAVLTMAWFSFRRWQDARAQLHVLHTAEAERQRYLERIQLLSAQVLEAKEQERQRLAEQLHDAVVQTLYACRLKLDLYARAVLEPERRRPLDEAIGLVEQSMEHARDLTLELTPPILQDLGLSEAIQWLQQHCAKQFGVSTQLERAAAWNEIPASFRLPVFHSVRELVTNASKHSRATHIAISARLGSDDRIHVSVSDDGCGFDAPATRKTPSFGLFSVEQRLSCIHGKLELDSAPGRGTVATLVLPRHAEIEA